MTDLAATGALPKPKRDLLPVLLPVIVALAMLPLIGSGSSWVTLTVASLAMGMMIFIMASGLTLVFGLMDVLNFGHGAFISVGAYVGTLVLLPLASWVQADSLWMNLAVLAPAAPVSYTHLDVYKRQPRRCAPAPASAAPSSSPTCSRTSASRRTSGSPCSPKAACITTCCGRG